MIIKKIIDYTENGMSEEKYLLLIEEKDEGWELTREEMEKLRSMTERSLEDFYGRRENELIEELSNLYGEYQSTAAQIDKLSDFILTSIPGEPSRNEGAVDTVIRLLKEKLEIAPEFFYECPDFIEPPESTETVKNVPKEAENEPKQAEKVQKEGKKAQKRAVRDFSKYIEMANKQCSRRMILDAMIKDFGVSESTAVTYYHTKIRTKPIPQKMMVKDPMLKEEIAALPDYVSYTDFKDALAKTDVGRGRYTVKALKTMYLETHQHIKW